jgi:NhaA family Na+:H+ antiporter
MAHAHSKVVAVRGPLGVLLDPIQRFLRIEAASGFLLLAAAIVALVAANTAWAERFMSVWKTPVGIEFGEFQFKHPLKHWINDGLMALFFFVVGLEIKRELVLGELKNLRAAALPLFGAIGGMVLPAAIFLLIAGGTEGRRGWGIPMATDIAFVVGCMALLASRIPRGLRVMILSLAIADDVGAILVIAIGYTTSLNLAMLGWAAVGLLAAWLLFYSRVSSSIPYVCVGAVVWYAFHESGVHATIAGVILGLMTPTTPMDDADDQPSHSLLHRWETSLHPWVSFLIMPVFALANAGVEINQSMLTQTVAIAVMLGLFVGKPLGITLFCWIAVKLRLAMLPTGVSWGMILGGGVLSGIGFTMALFIAGLALKGGLLDAAKIGILIGSACSAVVGMLILWASGRPERALQTEKAARVAHAHP